MIDKASKERDGSNFPTSSRSRTGLWQSAFGGPTLPLRRPKVSNPGTVGRPAGPAGPPERGGRGLETRARTVVSGEEGLALSSYRNPRDRAGRDQKAPNKANCLGR